MTLWQRLVTRIRYAVEHRPVRVVEAVVVLAAAVGITVTDDWFSTAEAIIGLLAVLGFVGGEMAQRWTTALKHPNTQEDEGRDPHPDELGPLTELHVWAQEQGLDPGDPASYEVLHDE